MLSIFKYIVNNNAWYTVPYWMIKAFFYQIYKRTIRVPFVKKLFNGKKMFILPFCTNASSFMYTAIPDKTEMMVLRKLADPDTILLDVGANIGEYCLMTMDKLKAVYAFEAHPDTAKICKMNFLLNGLDEQQVIVKAVSDSANPITFSNLPDGSPVNKQVSSEQNGIQVPGITLDAFIDSLNLKTRSKLLIKIDVEGYEKAVLLGAQKILSTYPIAGIILERFSDDFDEIKTLMQQWGYEMKPLSTNNVLCCPIDSYSTDTLKRPQGAVAEIQC